MFTYLLYAILFLPLISAIITGAFQYNLSKKFVGIFSSLILGISMLSSAIVFALLHFTDIQNSDNFTPTVRLFRWLDVGELSLSWAIHVDNLVSIMLVVVTIISFVVHLYSIGYMKEDNAFNRFFSYISLFTFFMLILITSSNLFQMFVGWEGVGLCSYLLIGFWYDRENACNASIKAFITNRVGDAAMLISFVLIFAVFGSLDFSEIFSTLSNADTEKISYVFKNITMIDIIVLLMMVGAMAKSAQIPLHIWLAGAMEGPTPVSALIHAATMVTAGIFLLTKMSPLVEVSPFARDIILIIGSLTAVFGATVALFQSDIKRTIAYSTCSQLGYMFAACGLSAYPVAMFHLTTHAFFKALLFLCAGNIIHALHHEQNINNMGGLVKKLPYTHILMVLSTLALAGIPPLAGFFSKDAILESAWVNPSLFARVFFFAGLFSAMLTAFYGWRLIVLVFYGKARKTEDLEHHPVHEPPLIMNIPLLLPFALTLFSGIILASWGIIDADLAFWGSSIKIDSTNNFLSSLHDVSLFIKLLPLVASISGLLLAHALYSKISSEKRQFFANKFSKLVAFSVNGWYFEVVYSFVVLKPVFMLSRFFVNIDIKLIDYLTSISPRKWVAGSASYLNIINRGSLSAYSVFMIIGILTGMIVAIFIVPFVVYFFG